MEQSIFRKESLRRVSSPEQLSDYLHITTPSSWAILGAVILIVAGMLVWLSVTSVESYAAGKAEARGGMLTLTFDDAEKAENVEVGMNIMVGDKLMPVMSVGQDSDGRVFAVTDTKLPNGSYEGRVEYNSIQLIKLLFN